MSIGTYRGRKSRRDKMPKRMGRHALSLEVLEDRCLLSAGFTQINLDSDISGLGRVTDPNLVNPWGIAFSPTGAFWFGDNGAGVSDIVDGDGQILPLVVTVPGTGGTSGSPTGTVSNDGSGFQLTKNGVTAPAHFLFASEDGTISAWSPWIDDTDALVVIDNSAQGAVYEGLALANGSDGQPYLFAADFGRGKIDVFDQNFHPVSTNGSFTDPNLPSGFAPFNVQNINDQLFVTYAKKGVGGDEDVPGAGNGFIDVYSPSGNFVERLASGGALNSPWGLTVAPQSFGPFAGALLVGNNGDGHINAYDLHSGTYLGQLTDGAGRPLAIDGLWGLTVGNDHLAGNSQTVYFAAGIDRGQHGLFGAIQNSQDGSLGTAGTLPYDPSSNDDDYPLPPAQGPTLGGDPGQSAPTPVLLSTSNSSFALAPTLSISSEFAESRTLASIATALSPTASGSTQGFINAVVAMGTVTGSGAMPAFLLEPSGKLTSANRSPYETRGLDGSDASSQVLPPLSLLLPENNTPMDSTEKAESTLSPIPSESGSLQPRNVPLPSSWTPGATDPVASTVQIESDGDPIVVLSANDNGLTVLATERDRGQEFVTLAKPATPTEAKNSQDSSMSSPLLRGIIFVVAAWLPWTEKNTEQKKASRFFLDSKNL